MDMRAILFEPYGVTLVGLKPDLLQGSTPVDWHCMPSIDGRTRVEVDSQKTDPELEALCTELQTQIKNPILAHLTVAGLRLWARNEAHKSISVQDVLAQAGYGRATFYRRFPGRDAFAMYIYQKCTLFTFKMYKQKLWTSASMNTEEFCDFSVDYLLRFASLSPNSSTYELFFTWVKGDHDKFNPHISELARIFNEYIASDTTGTFRPVSLDYCKSLITRFDRDLIFARNPENPQFPSQAYKNQTKAMLLGALQK